MQARGAREVFFLVSVGAAGCVYDVEDGMTSYMLLTGKRV